MPGTHTHTPSIDLNATSYYFDVLSLAAGLDAMVNVGESPIPMGLEIPFSRLFGILRSYDPTEAAILAARYKEELDMLITCFMTKLGSLRGTSKARTIYKKIKKAHDSEIMAIHELAHKPENTIHLPCMDDDTESTKRKEYTFCQLLPILDGLNKRRALSIYYTLHLWEAAQQEKLEEHKNNEATKKLAELNKLRLSNRKNFTSLTRPETDPADQQPPTQPQLLASVYNLGILLGVCFALTRLGISGGTTLAAIAIPTSIALCYVCRYLSNNKKRSNTAHTEKSWSDQHSLEEHGCNPRLSGNLPY